RWHRGGRALLLRAFFSGTAGSLSLRWLGEYRRWRAGDPVVGAQLVCAVGKDDVPVASAELLEGSFVSLEPTPVALESLDEGPLALGGHGGADAGALPRRARVGVARLGEHGCATEEASALRPRAGANLLLALGELLSQQGGELLVAQVVEAGRPVELERHLLGPGAAVLLGAEESCRPPDGPGLGRPGTPHAGPAAARLDQERIDGVGERVDDLDEDALRGHAYDPAGWLARPEALKLAVDGIDVASEERVELAAKLDDAPLGIGGYIVQVVGEHAEGVEQDAVACGEHGDDVLDDPVDAFGRFEQELPLVHAAGGEQDGAREDGACLRHAPPHSKRLARRKS